MANNLDRDGILALIKDRQDDIDQTFGDVEQLKLEIEELREALASIHWDDNPHFVHESNFTQHAMEMANGFGEIDGWPYDYIDWNRAADALQQDYRAVTVLGETYYVRG